MCTDYTNLNRVCPKDTYPLSNINRLVNRVAEHMMLSFLDAYSDYNQIRIEPKDEEKLTFITKFCNKVIPFGLKNIEATYKHLMEKVFQGQLGWNLEVFVDDMVVKSNDLIIIQL